MEGACDCSWGVNRATPRGRRLFNQRRRPGPGRLVVFKSRKVPHAVLETSRKTARPVLLAPRAGGGAMRADAASLSIDGVGVDATDAMPLSQLVDKMWPSSASERAWLPHLEDLKASRISSAKPADRPSRRRSNERARQFRMQRQRGCAASSKAAWSTAWTFVDRTMKKLKANSALMILSALDPRPKKSCVTHLSCKKGELSSVYSK